MSTKIHVNQHHIRSNKTKGTNLPVITIKQGKLNTYCNEVEILGPSRIIYGGGGPEYQKESSKKLIGDKQRGIKKLTVSNKLKG